MRRSPYEALTFALTALSAFLLDQLTKLALVMAIAFGHSRPIIDGFFALTHVRNEGAAFSLFWGHVGVLSVFATLVALAIVAWFFYTRPAHPALVLGPALIVGGAFGNIADRVSLGYVRDMFDLQYAGQNIFPIFNVADIAVFCGVCALLAHQAFVQPQEA